MHELITGRVSLKFSVLINPVFLELRDFDDYLLPLQAALIAGYYHLRGSNTVILRVVGPLGFSSVI